MRLRHVTADHPESSHVSADLPESRHVSADLPESRHVSADLSESCHISADLPEPRHVSSDLPEPLHVSSDLPEPLHVMSTTPEPCPVAVVVLQPSTVLSRETVIKRQRLASSVEDPPLVSARTAGIPKPAHFNPPVPELIPLSEALPMMGITLCCIWAAYSTTDLSQAMAPAAASPEVAAHAAKPPEVAVLASAPCMVVAPSNVLSACRVVVKETVTTVEPPEVAATAAGGRL